VAISFRGGSDRSLSIGLSVFLNDPGTSTSDVEPQETFRYVCFFLVPCYNESGSPTVTSTKRGRTGERTGRLVLSDRRRRTQVPARPDRCGRHGAIVQAGDSNFKHACSSRPDRCLVPGLRCFRFCPPGFIVPGVPGETVIGHCRSCACTAFSLLLHR
jgi:hypothetical protein